MFFNFQNPKYLALLFIIPILIFLHFYSLKHLKGKSVKFANFEAIARIKGIDIYSKSLLPLILNIGIVLTLIFAISGMTLYVERDVAFFSVVITVDNSQSMGATDFPPDRLTVAKETINNFIDSLPENTLIGIVSFSDKAVIESELISDKEKLKNSVNSIKLSDKGGTDIYEAVVSSYKIMENEENKVIVLISDGQINVGNIEDVVNFARDNSIIVHTFGVGTNEGGKTSFGMSKLDEDSLKSLAYSSNGEFFTVNNYDEFKESFLKVVPLTRKVNAIDMTFFLLVIATSLFIINYIMNDYSKIKI